jgi:hypothetical protein
MDKSHWEELYKLKLKFCYKAANFQTEAKKNPEHSEFKEKKREVLIELIDVLDDNSASDYLLNH